MSEDQLFTTAMTIVLRKEGLERRDCQIGKYNFSREMIGDLGEHMISCRCVHAHGRFEALHLTGEPVRPMTIKLAPRIYAVIFPFPPDSE